MGKQTNKAKKFFLIGSGVGAILSVAVALLMDSVYADTLKGTWRDAIAKDIGKLFHSTFSPDSFIVYVFFLLILLALAAIGGFFGAAGSVFIYRFLKFMGEDKH